jgi:hypothetical protein
VDAARSVHSAFMALMGPGYPGPGT